MKEKKKSPSKPKNKSKNILLLDNLRKHQEKQGY